MRWKPDNLYLNVRRVLEVEKVIAIPKCRTYNEIVTICLHIFRTAHRIHEGVSNHTKYTG